MDYPFAPRMDSRIELTGVYNSATGKTEWTLPFNDTTIDSVVLGNDFGALAGLVVPVQSVSHGLAFAVGRYNAGPCLLGRRFTANIDLTRPFRRDQNNHAILGDRLQMQLVQTAHSNTGAYSVVASMPNRTDRTREYNPTGLIEESGSFRVPMNGDTKTMQLSIQSDSPLPFTIASVDYTAEVAVKAGT